MSAFADAGCLHDHEHALPALRERRDRHIGDFHLLDVRFRRRSVQPPHDHLNPRLIFTLDGSLRETYASGGIDCARDTLSFHPALLPHRDDAGPDDARAIIIEICGESGRELLSLLHADVAPFAIPLRRLREHAVELSRALRTREDLMIESLTFDLAARAARLIRSRCDPQPVPMFFDAARAFIDTQLDRPLTLHALASRLRVTPRQLADAFRVHAQTTFRDYLRERRVARAGVLLRGGAAIAEAAVASGYCDQSHLTRAFRRVTGLTPAVWQRRTTRGETS